MLWMPLNWSVLFVSLVVAESRKNRPDQEMFRNIDKHQLLLSLMTELQSSYIFRDGANEKQNGILWEVEPQRDILMFCLAT